MRVSTTISRHCPLRLSINTQMPVAHAERTAGGYRAFPIDCLHGEGLARPDRRAVCPEQLEIQLQRAGDRHGVTLRSDPRRVTRLLIEA